MTDGREWQLQCGLASGEGICRALFQQTAVGAALVDTKTGVFLRVNRKCAEIAGYSVSEMERLTVQQITHPDDLPGVGQKMQLLLAGEIREFTVETRHYRKDGSVLWAKVTLVPLWAPGEQPSVHLVLVDDITQFRLAERHYQSLFQEMLNGFALHEVICDDQGQPVDFRYLAVNPAFERITGLAAADVVGKTMLEVTPETEPAFIERFGLVALNGEPVILENYFPRLDTHYIVSAFQTAPNQFASIFEDVTERKRVQREREELIAGLEAQNAELERFTYTVSHDLKSPLITIKGYIGLLTQSLHELSQDSIKSDLARISGAADRMTALLANLLELSRVGRLVNPPENVSVAELVGEALGVVGGRPETRQVKFDVAPDLPVVFGDRIRLLEVVQNLVENAVKYMGDQPCPRVEVGARCADGETIFHVRDNGIGIDPRFHEKVFALFDQLDPTAEGTGIGLALVKRIVEVHGGRIWLESEGQGQGSTFFVALPNASEGESSNSATRDDATRYSDSTSK